MLVVDGGGGVASSNQKGATIGLWREANSRQRIQALLERAVTGVCYVLQFECEMSFSQSHVFNTCSKLVALF